MLNRLLHKYKHLIHKPNRPIVLYSFSNIEISLILTINSYKKFVLAPT